MTHNTIVRSEYPAPNNMNLSRAVKLTARELQASGVSVDAITVEDDCALSVEFLVETGCRVSTKLGERGAILLAQTKLALLGIPLTAQVVSPERALDPSVVGVRCRFLVEPQECWPDVSHFGLTVVLHLKSRQIDVRSYRSWHGVKDDYLAFLESGLLLQSPDAFMMNVWRKFPWHMHWFLRDAYYQVTPVSADGKSVTITYQPFHYGFGKVSAPACNYGHLGNLLFVHALRPVMNCC
jgi:hypothetical protein